MRVVVIGNNPANNGYLDLFVNDGSTWNNAVTGYQTSGAEILNTCYSHAFAGVAVQGTNHDGIDVSIEVRWEGESDWRFMECTSCHPLLALATAFVIAF